MLPTIWLNVDVPSKTVRVHKEECRYCRPSPSLLKGVNKMEREGAWFSFDTYQEAMRFYREHFLGKMALKTCKVCDP
jgi:hypothetical protein